MQQILFILLRGAVAFFAYRSYGRIIRNIRFGQGPTDYNLDKSKSWQNVFLVAFGQKKMFQRWIPAILHLFIYVASLFTQIELIEIIIDGVFGVHRFFASTLGGFYTLIVGTIEILSLGALIATVIFLARRKLLKLPRFVKSEMKGWPTLDANYILLAEIVLVLAIFTMNGADTMLQKLDSGHYPYTGFLPISGWLGPALFSSLGESTLHLLERAGWWTHILVVFGFLLYLPLSKHLHILLAFPNTYFARQNPRGEMSNMPAIMNEVKSMMGLTADSEQSQDLELPTFGAKDVKDLSWTEVLSAYTCTECGRCTDECPANKTGKKLSPRKIMMDVRDRADHIGASIDNKIKEHFPNAQSEVDYKIENFDDGKSLFDYITREEIHACTTCNACVEACPVLINPMDIILQLRRYEILTESAGPADWLPMFTSLENQGSVWQIPAERDAWRHE